MAKAMQKVMGLANKAMAGALPSLRGVRLLGSMRGTPVLVLTVPGRRSGEPRSDTGRVFPLDQDGWLVVGSAGGMPQEPDWFKNLREAPIAPRCRSVPRVTEATCEVLDEPTPGRSSTGTWSSRTLRVLPLLRGQNGPRHPDCPAPPEAVTASAPGQPHEAQHHWSEPCAGPGPRPRHRPR